MQVVAAIVSSILSVIPANAQVQNGRVRGDSLGFQKVLLAADTLTCESVSCTIRMSPIRLTLSAPQLPQTRVVLTEAKLSNPIQEPTDSAPHQTPNLANRPILIRGYVETPASWLQNRGGVPVAATIFRDGNAPSLEIALPEKPPRGYRDSRGGIVLRVLVADLSSRTRHNARAQAPPGLAYTAKTCGVTTNTQRQYHHGSYKASSTFTANNTFNVLYVGTDYDAQYASKTGCGTVSSCRNKIISTLHRAAIFYQDQLGYTLEVARQFGPSSFGKTTMSEALLDLFQQYNYENRFDVMHTGDNSIENQVDLFQFFTGRTMDGDTIGIAYVATACENNQSRFADLVVQRVSDTLDPVTTAHEIGHTLSAEHTQSGIMRPNLGRTPPTSFASSSLLAISGHLSEWYRECRQGTSEGYQPSTPTPTPGSGNGAGNEPNPFEGKPVTLQLRVGSPMPKTLSLGATVSSITSECSVKIRAGTTYSAAAKGLLLLDAAASETATVDVTRNVSFRVDPGTSKSSAIYFFAEYSCQDGTIVEVSRVKKFNPNRIKGLAQRRKSKRSWIKALAANSM